MTAHDPPPTEDEIRQAIWAATTCTCTPAIRIRRHTRGRTRVQARHQPGCPVRTGHQRIHLDAQSDQ